MSARDEHRFTPTTLYVVGSLLIWLGNFVIVYVVAALACARGFADMRLLGLPLVPLVCTVSSLSAAGVTVALLRRGARQSGPARDEHAAFIDFVAFATSVLAIIAFALVALPPLLVGVCQRS